MSGNTEYCLQGGNGWSLQLQYIQYYGHIFNNGKSESKCRKRGKTKMQEELDATNTECKGKIIKNVQTDETDRQR